MALRNHAVTLTDDQLNSMDRKLLDVLHEGRLTPTLAKHFIEQREGDAPSRQYLNDRLGRLAEHEHIENLFGLGVYELREDPRDD